MSDHRRLRKDTIQFLDVKEETSLPVRVLPQGIDVLKLMLGRKSREKDTPAQSYDQDLKKDRNKRSMDSGKVFGTP